MKNRFLFLVIGALCFLQGTVWGLYNAKKIYVTKVIDGDTIEIDDGRRVRLLGIDCREISENDKLAYDVLRTGQDKDILMQQGKIAREFVKEITKGNLIELKTDMVNSRSNHIDAYGRLLAYVKVYWKKPPEFLKKEMDKKAIKKWKPKWVSLNLLLLSNGHAEVYKRFPFSHQHAFEEAEKKAKKSGKGIWAIPEVVEKLP